MTQPATGQGTPPVLSIPGLAPELRERVLEGMARVEALLSARVAADDPFLSLIHI